MQNGDLSEWHQPRLIIVIEGVLCTRYERVGVKKRLRKPPILSYHTQWHDTPLKRCAFLGRKYPDTALELITFVSQDFADEAAEYLTVLNIPYTELRYTKLDQFANMLRFQQEVRAVYDSDPARLSRYGQLGVQVVAGQDF